MKWFNKQSRLVQILLLLIPGVNWATEIIVRWTTYMKKGGLIRLIISIITMISQTGSFGKNFLIVFSLFFIVIHRV